MRFGNASTNLFTLGAAGAPPAPASVTGTVAWGNPTLFAAGVKGFVDTGYVWTNQVTLINVPS